MYKTYIRRYPFVHSHYREEDMVEVLKITYPKASRYIRSEVYLDHVYGIFMVQEEELPTDDLIAICVGIDEEILASPNDTFAYIETVKFSNGETKLLFEIKEKKKNE